MNTLGDGPAFARPGLGYSGQDGMSLRAYLAGQALAGLCASTGLYDSRTPGSEEKNALVRNEIAAEVVAIADATLKELAKEGR